MPLISSDPGFFSDFSTDLREELKDLQVIDFGDWGRHGVENAVALCHDRDPASVAECFRSGNLRHLVQKDSPWMADELKTAARFLSRPEEYFQKPAELLVPVRDRTKVWDFDPSTNKVTLFDAIQAHVDHAGDNLSDSVRAICEELYMNAMIDAPRAAIRSGLETKPYSSRGSARLHVCVGDDRIAIACEDPYGELDPAAFVQRMDEVYTQGAGHAMRMGPSMGAGIGCVLMFEHTTSLFLGVHPREKTLVSCVIAAQASAKRRAGFRKNLHLIYYK